ncbi:protein of unknown function [Caminicella sporogenes DSM 14501]|uniref:DUF3842 family protein n=1 Tax=Caminicella sporogenes DSM 14501 TaxID=1121266 RepID=A0A1M6NJV3_9FIRM|nr:DUF3842 family protein [Caminicella sporogenes]RKD22181.1 hypothetical protein BET04_06050 [Caminicella sporogenes]SHJ95832.1 protein of unknown function [Caminicella sporogenes DSM 14501]
MKVAILDAQGAGLGQTVIKKIRKEIGKNIYLIALGTNQVATSNMIKAGADEGLTGERSIFLFCKNNEPDCIIGPIGIICSGGIKGEITPLISKTVFEMNCTKYIIPLKKHGIYIPGTRNLKIKEIIEEIVFNIKEKMMS